MLEKIRLTLKDAIPGLKQLQDEFYIIGSAAIALSGVGIADVKDIDILTSSCDSDLLKELWKDKYVITPPLKDSDRFRSEFARFGFPEMDVEALGDFEIRINGEWTPMRVNEYEQVEIDGYPIKIPTKQDMIRILQLFNREKDHKRIELIKEEL